MLTVNLTTTHSRLHLCSATVWSLMNQSLKPDFIVLWVSRDSYLSDEGIKQTPDFVQKFNTINNIIVVNYVSNTGPIGKSFLHYEKVIILILWYMLMMMSFMDMIG